MESTFAPPAPSTTDEPGTAAVSGRRKLDLLLRLAQQQGDGDPGRIRRRPEGAAAPLSFGQERLWLLSQMDGAGGAYHVRAAFRLPRVDAAVLERALGETVRRHQVLRTTFREVDGAAVQVVAPFDGFTLPVDDLSSLDAETREAEVLRRAADEGARPYDLASGPLFRPRLLRLDGEDVLLLNMHHVVSDGWSMPVLFRELMSLYAAYAAGQPSPLPELPVQYADYAAWQRERMSGETLERHLAYWKGRLAGAPALLELPTDHPRPAVQSYRGARETVELPAPLAERLRALAQAEDATLFMVLLAAFQLLLARYAGTDDVVVGTPVAGRPRRELEGLIGFFVNTLVLRTDLSGDPRFRELLRRVRQGTLGAFEHQEMPFERLVAELQPERTLSHAPLFQVAFTTEAPQAAAVTANGNGNGNGAGVPVRAVQVEGGTAQFDLTLTVQEWSGGLRASLAYSTDLFERATARRMLGHLQRVLEQVARDADRRLSGIVLAAEDEQRMLLDAWNRTARPFPRTVCLHELFAAQVHLRPDAPALAWGGLRLTYAELDARTSRLAHHLRALGVRPDARVGVLLERGPELIIGILAIIKAGGCYVPLDPAYPAERLRLMAADGGIGVVVTASAFRAGIDGADVAVVSLDESADEIAAQPSHAPVSGATPDNLAYIVYTSGSTGRPKGVMVGHREVVQLVVDTDYVSFGPGDRIAQASNASFDALAFETWGALLNGATLVGIPRDVLLSPAALREMLREEKITTLYQTTALLNQLVGEQPDIFATLREVLFGGQAVDPASVRRLLRSGKPQRLLHMYGPTETTAWCSYEDVQSVAEDALTVSVGRPTGNQRIYLLDAALQPVPVGVPGEAYVGGAGVVRGYLDRPALTAERFLPDPWATVPGGRMYKTGDRLRWKADGTLEFMGRLDAQVKIRGFRIEPGEIESVLSTHPDVREARVIPREDTPGEKRLVAYVVGQVAADELRAHLRRTLPEYMVPAAFVSIDRLPLTPNGKLDVKALPAPELASDADRYVAPRTPVEEVLAGIWAEVLRIDRVGAEDDFFELGGHSLLATRVVSRVREVFAVELPLRALFEASRLGGLAARIEELRGAGAAVLPPVVPVPRTGPLPLSFAQERLWFIDRLQPGSAFYNSSTSLRLYGALDAAALDRALGETLRRHEVLRTTFAERDGRPVQVIAPFAGFHMPVDDLSALPHDEREAEVRRRAGDENARPFDLLAGPLFRARLLRVANDDHVLLLGIHHIVTDGWSQGVLVREISTLYNAFREGRDPGLPELPVQYADYAVWQREQLRGAALERQLDWWRARLADAPALLELPTDFPRPAVQTFRGARVPVQLGPELSERLESLGRAEGATLFMVLLGAFQVLLGKYAGTDDVIVGCPIAGRGRKELEELIGFFVNSLALRTDLSGDPSFREVLRRVRDTTLGAYEHQEVPFERLVAELQPERSLSHSPLFQVMFTVQAADRAPVPALPGLRAGAVGVESATARHDLTLNLASFAGGVAGTLEYGSDLFGRATAERMVRHLGVLLETMAADPDLPLSRVPLLAGEERERVLVEWNRTRRPYPRESSVHALFAEQAARTPHAAAVVHGDAVLTYAALDRAAARLARALRARGVGADARVGICGDRSPEQVVAMLAVLRAGGAYVPLDPAYPPERLAFMAEDSGISLALAHERFRGRLPSSVTVIPIDGCVADADAVNADDDASPDAETPAGALAYVIYTSGSTGRPKGVAVHHRGIVRLVRETEYAPLGADDRVAQVSNTSFDAATWEIWGPLLNGGSVVVIGRDLSLSPADFAAELRARGVTGLFLTTALFNRIADEVPDAFATLRHVLFGGELVDPARVRRVLAAGGPERLLHVYGPTECTTFSSWHLVDRVDDGVATVPIGAPLGHGTLYVLDAALQPVPAGVPGELYVGGDGVARGYLGRPALTAERFVPDAFGGEAGARLYRTGDRVRWLPQGAVEFLGRVDHQVKIRGFRIEPGEIEAVLARHPAVRDVVVAVRTDDGEKRLVAWVAGTEPGAVTADELRAHLREVLPDYMVPGAFVVMDALPLNPNGKVDRGALPAPDYSPAGEDYQAPRTPVEETLAEIMADVLGLDRVGLHDGFFELGGHSLLATRMISRVRAALSVEMELRALFEAPTVAALAERVEDLLRQDEGTQAPPLVPAGRDAPLPLSFAQQRLWFIEQLRPGHATYNIPVALRLRGALRTDALEGAITALVARHEVLRTSFRVVDGEPVQVIADAAPFSISVEDLRHLDADERGREALRLAGREAARPFDLSSEPPLRVQLLRLGDEEWGMLFTLHHIAGDGWSMGVLVREVSELYAACRDGRQPALADLPVQYADYAAWQRGWLAGEVLETQLGWWRDQLAGAPPLLEIPTDRPRPAVQGEAGARVGFRLPASTSAALRTLSRREGTTLFMTLLAGWQLLLARYSGQDDVVVGSPIAGRNRLETEGLIGFFVNTLVLRTDLSGAPSFRQLLGRVRESMLGAWQHQEIPFEKLVEELRVERSLSHTPLFQTTFTFQKSAFQEPARGVGGLRAEALGEAHEVAKFDLALGLYEEGDALAGGLTYRTELFDAETAERMLAHLSALLEAAAAEPDRPVTELPLLAADERRALEGWNATERDYDLATPLHARVEEQVRRTPDAVAVRFENEELTYGELDRRANQLAHHLRGLGVGPETRVGVCLERSPEMVIALLGVLKAGGAYVPIDPSYPAQRIEWMLADSAVPVVLTIGQLADALPAHGATVVRLDADAARIESESSDSPSVDVSADHLAYVIYTSGSTGRPKGAMNAHRGIGNRLAWMQEAYGLDASDVVLQKTPFSFDVSVWEFFWPLITGAKLVLARPGAHGDAAYLAELTGREGVTTMHFVPSMLQAFAESVDASRCGSLRRVMCSGEALPYELMERCLDLFPATQFHNLYGPTEAAVDVTYWACERRPEARVVPIGRPVANTRIHVLDRSLNAVPPGVAGELLIGGVQVGRGYLARPALTAERFVPDPFSSQPGARLYRTGDRARWTADGEVEYLGRIDFQVKIRGFRIEPGEVEGVLRRHPGVADCAVVVRDDGPGGVSRLVAYLVGESDAEALRAHLRKDLPDYMVPAAFVSLDALPLSPNGKLDRRALPAPARAVDGARRLKPGTELEARLAAVWQELLGAAEVGVEDNFFDLGGHSLLLVRLQARVAAEFERQVSVMELFQYPTVRAQAGLLQGGTAPAESAAADEGAERGDARQAALARRLEARRRRDG